MSAAQFAHLFTGEAAPSVAVADAAKARYRILLVDDEVNVLSALKRVFRQENYEVVLCSAPKEALELVREQDFQLMISDYMMPGMHGGELLRQARALKPDMIRIMLTGHADVNAVVGAVKAGAVYKFILKPWNDDDLRISVALALEQYELRRKNQMLAQENQAKSQDVEKLVRLSNSKRSHLAMLLSKRGYLNEGQIEELLKQQQSSKEPLIREIVTRGWASEKLIHELLLKESGLQEVSLGELRIDSTVAALIPGKLCQHQLIVPVQYSGHSLTVAMADPLDAGLIEDLRFITGLKIVPVLAPLRTVQDKVAELYHLRADELAELEVVFGDPDPYEGIEIVIDDEDAQQSLEDLLHGTDEPPAIRLVNCIILEAIRLGASDIHIHPRAKNVMVRLRIDGVLVDKIQIPNAMHQSLVSRIKIMAELDITERRRPQDGRITVKTPQRVVDLRISSLPTINGEKLVLRVLDRNSAVLSLDALGFGAGDLANLRHAVDKPQGIILATGPTGSGKTTSLYSLLQAGANSGKNYVTIEDPVEYYLDSAGQVLVREKIGLSFPVVLRAILRQDPDVLLIGEIRDLETAEVSFHAALTGHQVFSTLHTNSAFDTIARLLDLGLKPFVIASALEAVIAQRLVRRICKDCGQDVEPDAELLQRLGGAFTSGLTQVRRGMGCHSCFQTGYKGRVGIYEILVINDVLRDLIVRGAALSELQRSARAQGFQTLRDAAYLKVAAGATSLEEVYRTLGPG